MFIVARNAHIEVFSVAVAMCISGSSVNLVSCSRTASMGSLSPARTATATGTSSAQDKQKGWNTKLQKALMRAGLIQFVRTETVPPWPHKRPREWPIFQSSNKSHIRSYVKLIRIKVRPSSGHLCRGDLLIRFYVKRKLIETLRISHNEILSWRGLPGDAYLHRSSTKYLKEVLRRKSLVTKRP